MSNQYRDEANQILYTYTLKAYNVVIFARRHILYLLGLFWKMQAKADSSELNEINRLTHDFYSGNELLYKTVNETTGDTNRQLGDFINFLKKHRIEFKDGTILDIGCGNGERITTHTAQYLNETEVIGLDLDPPATVAKTYNNLCFIKADTASIPIANNSVNLVSAHWSVLNDLVHRSQQMKTFSEIKRVLIPNGYLYFDVPVLEGLGGYEALAKDYHLQDRKSLKGTVRVEFPGNRSKLFYIYPKSELTALLQYHGFHVISLENWQSRSGARRLTVIALCIK